LCCDLSPGARLVPHSINYGSHGNHDRTVQAWPACLALLTMRLVIDLRSPVPSYQQLAGQLRDAIASGEIAPGEPLPSITALVQETGLAVGTVRHALRELADEGTITIVPGRGSYAR
jgi:hypothetical protein